MTKAIGDTATKSLKDDIDKAENGLTGTTDNLDDLPEPSKNQHPNTLINVDEKPRVKK